MGMKKNLCLIPVFQGGSSKNKTTKKKPNNQKTLIPIIIKNKNLNLKLTQMQTVKIKIKWLSVWTDQINQCYWKGMEAIPCALHTQASFNSGLYEQDN